MPTVRALPGVKTHRNDNALMNQRTAAHNIRRNVQYLLFHNDGGTVGFVTFIIVVPARTSACNYRDSNKLSKYYCMRYESEIQLTMGDADHSMLGLFFPEWAARDHFA